MAHEDQCSYPRCRQWYVVGLYGAFKLCQKHWEEYCKITLDDDCFAVHQVIRYEKQKLAFQSKCGWRKAARMLEKLKADPETHVLQHIDLGEGHVTVARHRELLELRRQKEEEDIEDEELGEFGSLDDYLGVGDGDT